MTEVPEIARRYPDSMEFGVLGPVQVADGDRPVALGPPRQRAVLAMLVLAAPDVVSTDRFVDGLWGEDPPARPLPALQVFVHGLRKALRDAGGDDLVQRASPGYRLAVDASRTDIGRFLVLHDRARTLRKAGDDDAACTALDEALALWRGPALADVRSAPFADAEAVRLDELRLLAEEDSYDVRLRLGQHHTLVTVLEQKVREHPMREHLWGQLMTALYRCDRQADALATYARARDQLADELGIDPGQALQQLELAVLRQDPDLAAPAPVAAKARVLAEPEAADAPAADEVKAPAPAVAPREAAQVPVPLGPTFGRGALVDRVRHLVSDPAVGLVTLTGPGGSGKSRVAAVVALAVRDDFPDGVAYFSVTELTRTDRLVRDVVHALTGSDGASADPEAGLELQALVVLDNLESMPEGADLVQQLHGTVTGLTVLVTSRLPLRTKAEHDVAVPPLEVPAEQSSGSAVADSPAVQLFAERARAADPAFDVAAHAGGVAELCRFLDGFPLGIELAAPHVRLLSPEAITAALQKDLGLLESRAVDVPERQRTLATTIEWSLERLAGPARTVVERLALFERGFTLEAVEALCPDVPDVLEALAQIVDARLIRSVASRVEVRFVLLGTVRSFVRARLDVRPADEEHRLALCDHLLERARSWAAQVDGAEGTVVIGRYDDTAADLDAAVDWAIDRERADLAVELVDSLVDLWIATGRLRDGLQHALKVQAAPGLSGDQSARVHLAVGRLAYHLTDWQRAEAECRAVLALPGPDATVEASARCHLGAVLVVTGRVEDGLALAQESLAAAEALQLYPLPAIALSVLAIGAAMTGDFAEEKAHLERRLGVVQEHGDLARLSDTLNTLAEIGLDEGDGALAEAYATESVTIAGAGLPLEARDATITLARASVLLGDLGGAVARLRRGFELADRTGQLLALAQCLRTAGCVAVLAGDPETAVRAFAAAQRLSPSPSGTDEPIERDLADRLQEARDALGEETFQRTWALGRTLPLAAVRRQVDDLLRVDDLLTRS